MLFNATFSNISVISVAVSFIGGGNQSTGRKPPTCSKLLTNFSHKVVWSDKSTEIKHKYNNCTIKYLNEGEGQHTFQGQPTFPSSV